MPSPGPSDPRVVRSRQNPRVVSARSVARDQRLARRDGVLFADGVALVREALRARLFPRLLLLDPDDDASPRLAADARRARCDVTWASRSVIESVSTLTTPQGAVGIFERPGHEFDSVYDVSRVRQELGFVAERTPEVVFGSGR